LELIMYLRRGAFAAAVGESAATVAGVYSRPGRAPSAPVRGLETGAHRSFGWADAVAWRITRLACTLGLEWDAAADIVSWNLAGRWTLDHADNLAGQFLTIWHFRSGEVATWLGPIGEAAELIEAHGERHGPVLSVRSIALDAALADAIRIAAAAGYAPASGADLDRGFRELSDGELEGEA
jgi:hypothetical protein